MTTTSIISFFALYRRLRISSLALTECMMNNSSNGWWTAIPRIKNKASTYCRVHFFFKTGIIMTMIVLYNVEEIRHIGGYNIIIMGVTDAIQHSSFRVASARANAQKPQQHRRRRTLPIFYYCLYIRFICTLVTLALSPNADEDPSSSTVQWMAR